MKTGSERNTDYFGEMDIGNRTMKHSPGRKKRLLARNGHIE